MIQDNQEKPLPALSGTPNRWDESLLRIWAVTTIALMVLSWKLWIPAGTDYPRVPLLNFDQSLLEILQYIASATLVLGLITTTIMPRRIKTTVTMIACGFAISFLCNQHGLQPWAWQAFIIATLLRCLPLPDAKKWIAWLMISIYLYSAIGKFDYQFVNSLGREFLGVICKWFGLNWNGNDLVAPWLVLAFPLGEFLIGIGLIFQRTRRLAAFLAIALHLLLIAILSPIGLRHRWPVLIWNGLSIALVCWLFLATGPKRTKILQRLPGKNQTMISHKLGVAFALLVLLGPLLRPIQLWDHWLAWGLYSPSNSRVELFLPDSTRAKLRAQQLETYLMDDHVFGRNRTGIPKFALDKFTLDELGVPIYPQASFQKTVATEFLRQHGLLDDCRLDELGPSNPRTGDRTRTQVDLSRERWGAP